MTIRHIKKRVFTGAAVGVTTLCGAKTGKKAWWRQDAREFLEIVKMVEKGHEFNDYGKTWEFCPNCKEKL